MALYMNPVLPGFYPDPSIVKTPEGYFLAHSSFEFYPGVPLFHSKDLINWEQIGHVLNRPEQLPLEDANTSGGIYAPTLRYHEGVYYMITTNVSQGGNFYVTTSDIFGGEWSEPVYVKQGGIDPSLFFDEDGTVLLLSTHVDGQGRGCIGQSEIDVKTGELLTETRPIWHGTGRNPEAPHMYRMNGWYYLMIAEGGTEYGHMESIARSKSAWGPFEACPRNPILTHKDTSIFSVPLQGLGHGDLTTGPDGGWWMVFHGIRPSQFMLHHLGRETCMAPVAWDADGWPVVYGGGLIALTMQGQVPGYGEEEVVPQAVNAPFYDEFSGPGLAPCWNHLRNPVEENYSLEQNPGGLAMRAACWSLDDKGSPSFIGRRQQHFNARVETVADFNPAGERSRAGLTVFHTDEHHYDLAVTRRGGARVAILRRRAADLIAESEPVPLPEQGAVTLRVDASRLEYRFSVGVKGGAFIPVGSGRTQLLSTECMVCTFTGCYTGLFVEGETGEEACFTCFSYLPGEE